MDNFILQQQSHMLIQVAFIPIQNNWIKHLNIIIKAQILKHNVLVKSMYQLLQPIMILLAFTISWKIIKNHQNIMKSPYLYQAMENHNGLQLNLITRGYRNQFKRKKKKQLFYNHSYKFLLITLEKVKLYIETLPEKVSIDI